MKLFNDRSGLRGLPCLAEGIYWATGLSLTTPFTEGCLGVNNKASPPGRHQEQAAKQRCTFSSTTFSSVQFSIARACGPHQMFCMTGEHECSSNYSSNFTRRTYQEDIRYTTPTLTVDATFLSSSFRYVGHILLRAHQHLALGYTPKSLRTPTDFRIHIKQMTDQL